TVFLKEAKLGAYTNKNGYYNIKNIPSGKYTLVVSSVGYKKRELSLSIKEGESRRLDIKLGSGEYTTADIIVEANRDMEKKQITISKVNVPIQQIKEIR